MGHLDNAVEMNLDSTETTDPRIGFLAVVDIDSLGSCGGLLVTNISGRPLEFHCTAPITANRAQQILYGQTLRSFLHCDQIGRALLGKAKSNLDILVVDSDALTELNRSDAPPLVLLENSNHHQDESKLDSTRSEIRILPNVGLENERDVVGSWLERFELTLPLSEPFDRIREAIGEAHKVAA